MQKAQAMLLDGKVALVTGAARGIGAATAARFVRERARVVVADRREEESRQTVHALNAIAAGSALFVPLDVASEEDWSAAILQTEAGYGRLDVLVNAAGIIRVAPIQELTQAMFRQVIDVNLIGTFLGMKASVEALRRSGGGAIVNFSSVQGVEGREGFLAYSASKFGVRALTKTAAIELGPLGIRVNTVIPGPIRTKMSERKGWSDEDYDRVYGNYPLGRMGRAEEVANLVTFLASDQGSFCTGGDYTVDGGVTAGKPRG